ncbi:IS4 family transposase [Paenibacillus mesophilus]|uniref:IS4 family transposase n=1 Tax=Paenibacillus mesophilus TaxID=2582849 RepID=UPI0013054206|nr:IS4 family transposase [Paenibacillus mesophilus]
MSVSDIPVIRQCLNQLPLQDFVVPFLDFRKQKLSTANLLKIFITAQLLKWDSLSTIENTIRSDEVYHAAFELDSISKSQLSRRINSLPTEIPQALFRAVVHRIQEHTRPIRSKSHLPLAVVDSTSLRMPPLLGDWAYVTNKQNSVKVHARLMVVGPDVAYPDKIVPSTGNVSDYRGSDFLVVDSDALYVMDRGYVCYKRMEKWASSENIHFVIRLANHHFATILEERELPAEHPSITRDAIVRLGNQPKTTMKTPLRLIEFTDTQGRFYRLATTRLDLNAEEVMEVYRSRWLIELFFKWLKQHLKFAQLYSHQPDAVWNHIFLALVAYGLSYLIGLKSETPLSTWKIVGLLRIYALKPWTQWDAELHRKPSKRSEGRQKKDPPVPRKVMEVTGVCIQQPKKRNR